MNFILKINITFLRNVRLKTKKGRVKLRTSTWFSPGGVDHAVQNSKILTVCNVKKVTQNNRNADGGVPLRKFTTPKLNTVE